MLQPPISSLSQELLDRVVDHCVQLPERTMYLVTLSLVDRVFTARCTMHIFEELPLHDSWESKKKFRTKIERKFMILKSNPSLARLVRVVDIKITRPQNAHIFSNSTFLKIVQLLQQHTESSHGIRFQLIGEAISTSDPEQFTRGLIHSSICQTLTTLSLCHLEANVDMFRVCPKLADITLLDVTAGDEVKTPSSAAATNGVVEPLTIERLNYRTSCEAVNQLIEASRTPSTPIINLSKLRILKTSPHERKDMNCVPLLLDMASETLEELYLTTFSTSNIPKESRQFPLRDLVNLQSVTKLRIFEIFAIINCKSKNHTTLHDLRAILCTIPSSNKLQRFDLDVSIYGKQPFQGCLDEDWEGLCAELVRVAAGKLLQFGFFAVVGLKNFNDTRKGHGALYKCIEDRMRRSFVGHPNITFDPLNIITQGYDDPE
ncbi:hypothetical protein NLJ89_g1659 [Agrocybe chaxingu]|uniref:Uncharacterized protein n=1 Tax=Agrocybe chaxingu TaxID=84603 RepID=A0A9W8TEV0_9AGAR|nr:hypothetical protein NLJ89_g1659 [Agrocybe chaxingu]